MVSSQSWGAFLEGQDLLLQGGELQDSERIVLHEEAAEGVPASANTHHHMFTMKHSNKDGLVSQSVAPLRQVLDGYSVRAVAGWVVHPMLPRLVEAAVLAAHTEGFDSRWWLLSHQQSLLQLNLLLQLHQHRRLHTILGDDAADLQQTQTNLPRLFVQHKTL